MQRANSQIKFTFMIVTCTDVQWIAFVLYVTKINHTVYKYKWLPIKLDGLRDNFRDTAQKKGPPSHRVHSDQPSPHTILHIRDNLQFYPKAIDLQTCTYLGCGSTRRKPTRSQGERTYSVQTAPMVRTKPGSLALQSSCSTAAPLTSFCDLATFFPIHWCEANILYSPEKGQAFIFRLSLDPACRSMFPPSVLHIINKKNVCATDTPPL